MTKINYLQNVMQKFVGIRGSSNYFVDQFSNNSRSSNFGIIYPDGIHEIAKQNRLVFVGEIHSTPAIIAMQCALVEEMSQNRSPNGFKMGSSKTTTKAFSEEIRSSEDIPSRVIKHPVVHVIMEHFSFEMQSVLDNYLRNRSTQNFEEFLATYHEIGTEGHDLIPYRPLLEFARDNADYVRVHAGFIPRYYARMLMKEGQEATLERAANWLPSNTENTKRMLEGTNLHYNIFESLISGRYAYPTSCEGNLEPANETISTPSDRFKGIFVAQLLKDVAMAHKVNQLIDRYKDDKFVVIAGNGHFLHYCGVPERVLKEHPHMTDQACLIVSSSTDYNELQNLHSENAENQSNKHVVEGLLKELCRKYGPAGTNPADYIYLYKDYDLNLEDNAKCETRKAYDKVGDSAHLKGSFIRAEAIMKAFGYTDEQFHVMAGPDAYNFQGVGNPHIHAHIQQGDTVLDVGSGLGIDSFIAAHYVGNKGRVVGVDISPKQVSHAQARAQERGIKNVIFETADMDNLPFEDETFDVIISNGAFCLAPNKEKSLSEFLRVLKAGGRISICTSTLRVSKVEHGVHWPLCMKMFIQKDTIQPICEKIGYVDVVVDDSDSAMSLELPSEIPEDSNPLRNKVHVGSAEFNHLEGYNMDEICARVCFIAHKPKLSSS